MVSDLPGSEAGMSQRRSAQGMVVGARQSERYSAPRPGFSPDMKACVAAQRRNDAQRQIGVVRSDGIRKRGAQVGTRGCEASGGVDLARPPQDVSKTAAKAGVIAGVTAVQCGRVV